MNIVDLLGYAFALMLFVKVLMHGYLDYVYGKRVADFVPTFLPIEYFLLPYKKNVDDRYVIYKKVCNFCYYTSIISGLLCLFFIFFT